MKAPALLTAFILIPIAIGLATHAPGGADDTTGTTTRANTMPKNDTKTTTKTGTSTGNVYCEVMPDAPKRDNPDSPRTVIGAVRFRCENPGADAMTLIVHLQRQGTGGAWVDVASNTFTVNGPDTAGTREETFRTREVVAGCSAGTYRTTVSGTSRSAGGSRTFDRTGPRTFDPCRPGVFSGT